MPRLELPLLKRFVLLRLFLERVNNDLAAGRQWPAYRERWRESYTIDYWAIVLEVTVLRRVTILQNVCRPMTWAGGVGEPRLRVMDGGLNLPE